MPYGFLINVFPTVNTANLQADMDVNTVWAKSALLRLLICICIEEIVGVRFPSVSLELYFGFDIL